MKERRSLLRFELTVPAKIELEGEAGEKVMLNAQTRNVSASGAFFSSDTEVPEDIHVDIELLLNVEKLQKIIGNTNKVKVRLGGKVIRSDSVGMAVAFDENYEISPSDD